MKRRKHTSDFKSQVALEAIRGEETVSQIASRYNVHPSQVQNWKAAALKGFSNVFEQGNRASDSNEEQLSVLERKVGQLTIENDFLKKSWQGYLKKGGLK
jgi:transposase